MVLTHRFRLYRGPSTSQFTSRDPALDLTRQPYSYSSDTPVNQTEPSGEWGFGKVGSVQAEAGIGIGIGAGGCVEETYLSGNNLKPTGFACGGAFAGGVANYQN